MNAVSNYETYFEFHKSRAGEREAMKRCKSAFAAGLKVALGQSSKPNKADHGYPEGFPKILWRLVTWLRGPNHCRRVALTILSSYRLMEAEPKYDFKSIFDAPFMRCRMGDSLAQEARLLKSRFKRNLRKFDPAETVIMSSGPYGSECSLETALAAGALLSNPKELKAVLTIWKATGTPYVDGLRFIVNSACTDWVRIFKERIGPEKTERKKFRFSDCAVDACSFIKLYVGVQYKMKFYMEKIIPLSRDIPERGLDDILLRLAQGVMSDGLGRSYLSRLTFVPKEGGGSRPVTPTNFFIQSALTPIHDYFMSVTSHEPGDCTYDESAVNPVLCDATGRGIECFSFDMSNATDFVSVRHHLYPIVSEFLGKRVAQAWYTLVKSEVAMPYCGGPRGSSVRFTPRKYLRDFEGEQNTKPPGNPTRWNLFRYSKGAPMGIRSLWPVFATFHHCFLAVADRIATQRPGRYLDVPDDIYDTRHGVRVLFSKKPDGIRYELKHKLKYGRNLSSDRSLCHRRRSLKKGDDVYMEGRLRSYIYLVLAKMAGFEFSKAKSVVALPGFPRAAEFSKRYFVSGSEITPVSAKAAVEAVVSRNPLHIYEVVSKVMTFYDDSSSFLKFKITETAGLSFRQLLGSRSRVVEFGVWASCPVHEGRYDAFLERMGLLVPWPRNTENLWRPLLSKFLREKLSGPIKEICALLKSIGAEDYGVSIGEFGIKIYPGSPLTTRLIDTQDYVPHEIRSLCGLVSQLGEFTEVDFLRGKTPYVRVLQQCTMLCASLRRLRQEKRRFIRFELSRGPIRETFIRLLKDAPISRYPEEVFSVWESWIRRDREVILRTPLGGP